MTHNRTNGNKGVQSQKMQTILKKRLLDRKNAIKSAQNKLKSPAKHLNPNI